MEPDFNFNKKHLAGAWTVFGFALYGVYEFLTFLGGMIL